VTLCLASLVNGATFRTFTNLSPLVTPRDRARCRMGAALLTGRQERSPREEQVVAHSGEWATTVTKAPNSRDATVRPA
jgi:hypothetical protein